MEQLTCYNRFFT